MKYTLNTKKMSKERKPRKLKKALKNKMIAIDLSTIPDGWDIEQWYQVVEKTGIVFYNCNYKGSRPPKLLSRTNKRIKIVKYHEKTNTDS